MRWLTNRFSNRNAQLDSELRFHLDQRAAELIAQGRNPTEARRQANIEFGGLENAKEQCREARRWNFLEETWRDIVYALRMLRRSPGFTAIAILTLALGIGANSAIFSVIDAAVLRPLPYPHPSRLVAVYRTEPKAGVFDNTLAYPFFTDVRDGLTSIQDLSAFHTWSSAINAPGEPAEIDGVASSASMFPLLGIRPILGRPFTQAEARRGAPPVALISESLWQSRFSRDPSVIGKSIVIVDEPYTIVGVFPDHLHFPQLAHSPDVWVPLLSDPMMKGFAASGNGGQDVSYLRVLGRLQPGTAISQAQAQASTVAVALTKGEDTGLRVASLAREVSSSYRTELGVILAAVGVVLLIACTNVAGLLIARAARREHEIALRIALGAGKRRIARQVLIESLVLSLTGGALGIGLACAAVAVLGHSIPSSLTQFRGITIDLRVLAFAVAISVFAGILFGSLPAWKASEVDVYAGLKVSGRSSSGGSGRRRRLHQGLAVVEVALAVTLLVGAGLLLRSFSRLMSVHLGFEPRGVAMASVSLPRSGKDPRGEWRAFVSTALTRLRAEPGVSQAAVAATPPTIGFKLSFPYTVAGQPAPPPGHVRDADGRTVTPAYFALMRIPLVAGRDFSPSDTPTSAPVCVVNQALVRASFPGIDPLGHNLMSGGENLCRIVGIVGDVVTVLGASPEAAVYLPFEQNPFGVASFLVRGPGDTAALFPLLRDSIHSANTDLAIETSSLAERVNATVAPDRFRTALVGTFAGLATLLAAVGIFGVLAYSVSRRTQEIGVRMALGATPREVSRQVVAEGLGLVAMGSAIGLAAALGLSRLMRSLFFHVSPADPLVYFGVALLLVLVAAAASYIPARRAARVDPVVALRQE